MTGVALSLKKNFFSEIQKYLENSRENITFVS